jgi:transcriptional regulator GlxA family with amidase domain
MTRQVVIVGHPGALGMELLGMRDILDLTNRLARERGLAQPYRVELATHDGEPIALMGGLRLDPVRELGRIRSIDTLIVVGGPIAHAAAEQPDLIAAVRRAVSRSPRRRGLHRGVHPRPDRRAGRPASDHPLDVR